MTDSPAAIAHGFALMVPAPDGVDDAISEVMARHKAELDAVLERYGVQLRDLLQPTWMRIVHVGDVEALRAPEGNRGEALTFTEYIDGVSEGDERTALPLAGGGCAGASCVSSGGGCGGAALCTCGPGMACSSPSCQGTPLSRDERVDRAAEVIDEDVAAAPVAGSDRSLADDEPRFAPGGDGLGGLRSRVERAQMLHREADANGWGRRNV